jgi:solute carrier family 25 phosphate transporter 23/24/25/41
MSAAAAAAASREPELHSTTTTIPPPTSIKSPAVEQFKNIISQPVLAAFCAGGVAGAVSRTVVSPLERLKILFQVQSAGRDAYKLSVGKALSKMWREEGWRGFMRGNGTNCIRIVPYSAVQFGSYNFYKRVGLVFFLIFLLLFLLAF